MIKLNLIRHTDALSHAGKPTRLAAASSAIRSYTEYICCGAGVVLGLNWAALISFLRGSESLDMVSPIDLRVQENGMIHQHEVWTRNMNTFEVCQVRPVCRQYVMLRPREHINYVEPNSAVVDVHGPIICSSCIDVQSHRGCMSGASHTNREITECHRRARIPDL